MTFDILCISTSPLLRQIPQLRMRFNGQRGSSLGADINRRLQVNRELYSPWAASCQVQSPWSRPVSAPAGSLCWESQPAFSRRGTASWWAVCPIPRVGAAWRGARCPCSRRIPFSIRIPLIVVLPFLSVTHADARTRDDTGVVAVPRYCCGSRDYSNKRRVLANVHLFRTFRVEIFPSRFTDFTRSREPPKTPTFRRYRRHLHFPPAISNSRHL